MTPSRTSATFRPPISEAISWLDGVTFPPERPLINVSQAAPAVPPPMPLREAMAEVLLTDASAHLYGPDLGYPPLRAALADRTAQIYGGTVSGKQVAITSGCNQAFAAATMALCDQGDEVIIPTPWYFNHKMWCDMAGFRAMPLPTGESLLPDPERAHALIGPRTRAIVLVTPNNPGGVEYPAPLIAAFRDLARENGLKLIVDETYRDFHSRSGAPHDLFTDPDWADTLIHLYSFSKAYRLTGHRVGAMIASQDFLSEVEKFIDSTTICPNQLGQRAALWGIENLDQWLASERDEILSRRAAIEAGFPRLEAQGWHLQGLGAYFACVQHPFEMPSNLLAPDLVRRAGVLLLPGTMATPADDPAGARQLRIAFANIDADGIETLFTRLENLVN
ncbi:aminotransferase [Rhodalgimonas zhirmunskyi]|uniref:aspartate transaminase n=1 Tax=Rhodalgimonas zhirmunskyi TaxID=2964767 RepID=A0AAJ1UAD4_9RHOB|nr:aminotransferase [Rhodoalgimonas zhirmunskyi]MDQ2092687.1 aminotransferase [Rhodoalgimonas zhirmunskyi]